VHQSAAYIVQTVRQDRIEFANTLPLHVFWTQKIVSAQTESSIVNLKTLLTYIYPSLRSQIESGLTYSQGERELVAVSNLIKTFAIVGLPQGVIHCLHHIVTHCRQLSALETTCIRQASEIERARLSVLPTQLDNLTRLSTGHEQYILKVLGSHASTLILYALHPQKYIDLPNNEQLETRYLGAVLESAITSTRLLLPSFVEQSGVYILISRLYYQDIHFAVEYIDKMPRTSDRLGCALELVQPVADRYGITPQSPPLLEDPRQANAYGYINDPSVFQYFYSQLLHLK